MSTIAHRPCRCNSFTPEISGIFRDSPPLAPVWPGRHDLKGAQPVEKPAFPQPAGRINDGCRLLLDTITQRIPAGIGAVSLRQIDLAALLQVVPVTIRRRTRQLQQLGLLFCRRGKNCMTYSLPRSAAPVEQPQLPDMPPVPTTDQPMATPTIAAISAQPSRSKSDNPRCPQHRRWRHSWMSTPLQTPLVHCPAATGPDTHCSWIYSVHSGQLNPPGTTELGLNQVQALLNKPSNPAPAPGVNPPPDRPVSEVAGPLQQVWSRAVDSLRGQMPSADIDNYLRPARAAAYDGETFEVEVARHSHLRWFSNSFSMRLMPQALVHALGRPAEIRCHFNGATA